MDAAFLLTVMSVVLLLSLAFITGAATKTNCLFILKVDALLKKLTAFAKAEAVSFKKLFVRVKLYCTMLPSA